MIKALPSAFQEARSLMFLLSLSQLRTFSPAKLLVMLLLLIFQHNPLTSIET